MVLGILSVASAAVIIISRCVASFVVLLARRILLI